MRTRIPPPLVGVATAAAMAALDAAAPGAALSFPGQKALAGAVALAGLAVDLVSVGAFWRAKTTVTPLKPEKAKTLVVTGLYRYSRNPMYLGVLMILAGWALWLGNPLNVVLLAGFVAFITVFQIKPEEDALREKFGADYEAYCKRVRRWI